MWPVTAVGVLLTGMGADGAKGLLAMRRAGWHTIAQDQATSIVYGMPKAAAKIDAAVEILPLDQIAGGDRARGERSAGPSKEHAKGVTHDESCRKPMAAATQRLRRVQLAAFACFWLTTSR